jgi:phytanoyl-CoA hydroxylase
MAKLQQAQIDAFHSEGYLIIDDAFPADDLEPLIAEFSASVEQNASRALTQGLITDTCPTEPFATRLARIIESAPDRSAADDQGSTLFENIRGKHKSTAMFNLLTHPAILDIVESFIGPEILAHPQFNVRAKLPNQDRSVVPWHQDLGYLEQDAADTFMVNFWLPLVDSTKENGCLEVIPGSHHNYVEHVSGLGPAGNFKGISDDHLPSEEPVCCPVPRGGVLLLQHRTIHRSVTNVSDTVRWSLDLRYSDPSQPTGRDGVPGFIARSEREPGRVAGSLEDWLAVAGPE